MACASDDIWQTCDGGDSFWLFVVRGESLLYYGQCLVPHTRLFALGTKPTTVPCPLKGGAVYLRQCQPIWEMCLSSDDLVARGAGEGGCVGTVLSGDRLGRAAFGA